MDLVFKILIYLLSLPIFGMGSNFLMLPSSVDQIAVGNHSTIDGASPINPALFSAVENQSNIQVSRGAWIGDINLMNISFNQSLKNKVFHFGINYSGLTGFEYRENRPEDLPKSHFSSYGLLIKSGFSIKNIRNSFGISFSYLKMGIETQETGGIGINFGFAHQFNQVLKLGVSLENIGYVNKINKKKITLPTRLITTLSSKIFPDKYNSTIYGSIDWDSDITDNKYLLGNSTSWNNFNLYNGFLISENLKEFSAGFSIKINSIDIGYGKKFSSHNLGSPQIISFKILLP
tara:strand:+ start:358 stop:1227 length:870 start_codon:yes stop_codon:yes gene_type:complete